MAELRVLLDSYWWFDGPTSCRNVVRSIVRTWAEDYPDDRLTLTARPRDVARLESVLDGLGIRAEVRAVPRWARIHALAAVSLSREARGHDLLLAQNFSARGRAPSRAPSCTTRCSSNTPSGSCRSNGPTSPASGRCCDARTWCSRAPPPRRDASSDAGPRRRGA
ncbi:hypothetical protein [Homoserinibacter gongjuensis]|uniref:Uncharacterized protein n=1 Tax=Homoserinibacter gongjuensis TaxID=1162968 RepID=A0ABQ6K091_9MICO|nr:hypothetical protein [Homoserinibacter gongjuensis]GMA92779.1 hypothetical protein GCM10025869_33080 [Homoserinibacter gongjuensis]